MWAWLSQALQVKAKHTLWIEKSSFWPLSSSSKIRPEIKNHRTFNLREIQCSPFITLYYPTNNMQLFSIFDCLATFPIQFRGTVSLWTFFFYCFPVTWRAEHWWRQTYYLAASTVGKFCLIWFFTSQPTIFQLYQDWTSTKQGLMWQSSDAVQAQIRNTQAFYHKATALSTLYEMVICCKTEKFA